MNWLLYLTPIVGVIGLVALVPLVTYFMPLERKPRGTSPHDPAVALPTQAKVRDIGPKFFGGSSSFSTTATASGHFPRPQKPSGANEKKKA